jgi:DNA-binding PadR family transcriptional regulator
MGHRGFSRQWAGGPDHPWQHRGRGRGGAWGGPEWGAAGPPPWLGDLFGMGFAKPERGRGPRVRRGDVRHAILDVVARAGAADEAVNGYQVIQQIAERSDGEWRPSPGSVDPPVQPLQDEGLLEIDEQRGRRALVLTALGQRYVEDHADELAAVWAPFEREAADQSGEKATERGGVDLKSEIGQVMPAVWQIVTQGSDAQRRAALEILAETRRKLYGVLADGPAGPGRAEDDEA